MTKPLLFALCLLLAGCPAGAPPEGRTEPQASSPAKTTSGPEETVAAAVPPAPVEPAPALPAPATMPPEPAPAAGLPSAARRPPEDLLTQDGVYYGCKSNLDCEVKDVGNCCGYYPACVNKESPTFPEKVKAACAASGTQSICGFPEIAGCQCVEGRCTPLGGPASGTLQQE